MTELIHTFNEATGQRSARKLDDIAPPAPASKLYLFDRDVDLYHNNSWYTHGGVPGLGGGIAPFNVADTNGHYQVKRACSIDATVTFGGSDVPWMGHGGYWQVYCGNGNWLPVGYGYDITLGGQPRATANATLCLRAGDYFRFVCRVHNGGENTYPGNRSLRVRVEELSRVEAR